jgi:AAHS family 4-hydroxybenzoate transporter-like MFS transporter
MGSHALSVSEIIDQRPLSRFQIRTIVLCGLVLILDGYDALTMGYLVNPVAESTRIPVHSFGPILSASLLGLMVAALGTGPIADRWGRKWPVILSAFGFAVFAILTAHATTFLELFICRFLTGLGLGGAMPNVVALASEYAPKPQLPVVVAVLFSGMPIGGMFCGLLSSVLIPTWGWKWVLYIGGIVPIAIALLLIVALPESVRFLVVRGKDAQKIREILARISPEFAGGHLDVSSVSDEPPRHGAPVRHLFTEGRALGTILLWIPNFLNLLLLYFINSWLPALLRESGMTVSAGVTATAFVSFGGVFACLAEGFLIKRGGAHRTLIAEFGLSALLIAGLSYLLHPFGLALAATFVLGFQVIGAQAGLNALAAKFYPTSMRSTGVGWALGIGRIGSIIGPLLAGMLLTVGWKPRELMLSGALCGLCASLAIWFSKRIRGTATAYTPDSELGPH